MIEIKNLVKKFGNKTIINDFSLSIQEGQIVAIVGPSGGGKTTLLRCISGLETFDEGSILIGGQPLAQNQQKKAKQIGVVFQDFNLFPHLNVLENVILAPQMTQMLTKEAAIEQASGLLSELGLAAKLQHYPFELSGGQKQRVAIARALILAPQVLCYDEPTSALDPELRDNVAETLLNLRRKGVTQIVVTHDVTFAEKIADQLITVQPVS